MAGSPAPVLRPATSADVRKLAALLLRSRLKCCDQDGQPAYLETKPDGVSLYEHFDFQRVGDVDMPEGAPRLTTMWRAPAT